MKRVLIVEDDELLREMYATKFEMHQFEVAVAEDGQRGLELALHWNPDIMILDNLMPRLTGLQLLEAYNRERPHHEVTILLLSNKSTLEDINRAKELGASEYLIKSQYAPKDIVAKFTE